MACCPGDSPAFVKRLHSQDKPVVDPTGFHQRVIGGHSVVGGPFHCETGPDKCAENSSSLRWCSGAAGMEPGGGEASAGMWPSPCSWGGVRLLLLSVAASSCAGRDEDLAWPPSEVICERNALMAVKMPNQLSSALQAVAGHVKPRVSSLCSIQAPGLSLLPPPLGGGRPRLAITAGPA